MQGNFMDELSGSMSIEEGGKSYVGEFKNSKAHGRGV